jgi:hypothetical protein
LALRRLFVHLEVEWSGRMRGRKPTPSALKAIGPRSHHKTTPGDEPATEDPGVAFDTPPPELVGAAAAEWTRVARAVRRVGDLQGRDPQDARSGLRRQRSARFRAAESLPGDRAGCVRQLCEALARIGVDAVESVAGQDDWSAAGEQDTAVHGERPETARGEGVSDHRKRGRPSLSASETSTGVTVTMPVGLYDRAYALASKERVSVPEVMRRALSQALANDRAKPPRERA